MTTNPVGDGFSNCKIGFHQLRIQTAVTPIREFPATFFCCYSSTVPERNAWHVFNLAPVMKPESIIIHCEIPRQKELHSITKPHNPALILASRHGIPVRIASACQYSGCSVDTIYVTDIFSNLRREFTRLKPQWLHEVLPYMYAVAGFIAIYLVHHTLAI